MLVRPAKIRSVCNGSDVNSSDLGDALAFPLHWYYSRDIALDHKARFYGGEITGYTAVHVDAKHPDSWKYFSK